MTDRSLETNSDDVVAIVRTFEAFTEDQSQSYTTIIGSQYDCQDIRVEIAMICDEWRRNLNHS